MLAPHSKKKLNIIPTLAGKRCSPWAAARGPCHPGEGKLAVALPWPGGGRERRGLRCPIPEWRDVVIAAEYGCSHVATCRILRSWDWTQIEWSLHSMVGPKHFGSAPSLADMVSHTCCRVCSSSASYFLFRLQKDAVI